MFPFGGAAAQREMETRKDGESLHDVGSFEIRGESVLRRSVPKNNKLYTLGNHRDPVTVASTHSDGQREHEISKQSGLQESCCRCCCCRHCHILTTPGTFQANTMSSKKQKQELQKIRIW